MITVIVPIYNAEKYLRECLDSIANQTFKDIEILLVNDGSTDSSKDICEEYCDKYNNFRLINKENGGQMSAWIMAVKEAKGDYLGFVDSDDYIEPTMYEKMMNAQQEHDSDLVMCSRYLNNLDGTIDDKYFDDSLKDYYSKEERELVIDKFLPTLTGNLSQARWDKIFKKDLYIKCMERYCSYHARTLEDRFIVTPYIFYSNSFSFVNEPLYHCRILEGSSSKKFRPELPEIVETLFSERMKLLNDLGIYDSYIYKIQLEKLDFVRILFFRMVCVDLPKKQLIQNAKTILSKENRDIVISHKKDCVGKFGKYLYLCAIFNSPRLLVFGRRLRS